jgi:hypothetical protein
MYELGTDGRILETFLAWLNIRIVLVLCNR